MKPPTLTPEYLRTLTEGRREQIIASLSPKQRLAGLSVKEILAGLSTEEILELIPPGTVLGWF